VVHSDLDTLGHPDERTASFRAQNRKASVRRAESRPVERRQIEQEAAVVRTKGRIGVGGVQVRQRYPLSKGHRVHQIRRVSRRGRVVRGNDDVHVADTVGGQRRADGVRRLRGEERHGGVARVDAEQQRRAGRHRGRVPPGGRHALDLE